MGTFDNKTILILSQQGQDIMSQKQKIASWGYQVHFYDLQNPLNLNRQTHLVLIDIHLFQQTEISTKLKNLEKTAETIGIPILAYTIGQNIETATCKFPTICLNNIQLSRDYIRLLLLENERFENSDDLAKILMLKEREKENFRIKFEQNEQSYKSIFTTLLSPVLILSKWGNVITFSKGAQTLLGEELNQRQQLAKGIHPEDLKNIREIFKSFNQQQTQEANLIIRIKTQFSKYKTYKIYLTNYLNSQELKFVFVSIDRFEKSQKSKKVEVNSSLFTSFFNQFIEPSIFDKEQSKGSIIDGIMAIIPQIQYIAQVFFVQWDANQQQFVSGQQWCNTNKNFIQNFPVKIQQIKNPLKIFNYLRQHNLNEIQSAQYPIEITELSKDLATESIIPVCFFDSEQNGTIVIFALNKNLGHPSNEEFTISNQIIGNAVAYVQNQNKTVRSEAYDFLNFLPVPISIKNSDHQWVLANDAILSLINLKRADVIGKTDYELFPEEYANVFWETDELVLVEKVSFQNEEYISTNGTEERIVVTNKSIFHSPDGQDLIVSTLKDVTKLKHIEKALRERTEMLRKNEHKLKILNSTKDRFFSIIAHDLKNPFNTLIGFSSILSEDLDQFDKSEIEEFVKIIAEAAQSGYKLLENLLDWARTQTGRFSLDPSQINLSFLIDECVELLSSNAERKKITLQNLVEPNVKAYADANMIEMVIRNLLSNAIKFTETGGTVSVRAEEFPQTVVFSITDTGVGISAEDIKKLFRIDVEFTSLGTDAETGTGLGLILSKEFVEKNHGEIRVESKLGIGSKFTVSLPKNAINPN